MKMKEAMAIIRKSEKAKEKSIEKARKEKTTGFMVHFEVRERSILAARYFPDKHAGEKLIKTEEEAWELAHRFAKATPENYVNIYVIRGDNFVPVVGYNARAIRRYRG